MTNLLPWITGHWLEIFGALTGIIYVFLEIRQNIWLWPVGIVTSSVYIIVFFTSKFYADMGLQVYYLVISFYGWYAWRHGTRNPGPCTRNPEPGTLNPEPCTLNPEPGTLNPEPCTRNPETLHPARTPLPLALKLAAGYVVLHATMWYLLANHTDSPVAGWDSFTTALSVIATWMLARKYIEHWIIWIVVNIVSMILYIYKGLYPTTALFLVYTVMAFAGYREWRSDIASGE
ncbi:MAG: nicotinamide riboside transporter PnuC [Bacteroidales bacterium]|jgi:nicotinamide mononucleotide transporter|nr:nicotinamide riboside transporter PnuC [Bacteroidales bacterium]